MSACPDCGADNLAGANFCSTCGRRFERIAPLPARPRPRALPFLVLGVVVAGVAVAATLWLTGSKHQAPTAPNGQPGFARPSVDASGQPGVAGPSVDAKVAVTEARLAKVVGALDSWLAKHMSYPELAELLVRDDYLRPSDFDDAWGRRIDYTRLDAQHYRLCSRGPDNLPKSEDDVCLGGRP